MDIQDTWLVLLPAVITVCVAVVSRRPIESLLAGILVGLLMLGPTTALDQFSSTLLEVMMSETIAWVIIVCGLMGSLIMLLLRAGSVDAFSAALAAKAKSSKSALMYTWLLGIIVFIDDYLNALAVGAAMRKVTDQFGVSREKLAYVVDSTAAPICVLVPISTWAVFYASLFQESGFAEPGQGMELYISAIPPFLIGAFVGFLAAIMGVGGGFVMVPAMIYLLGMPTKVVVGTSLFQIIFVTAFTTMLHATTNYTVDMVLAVLLLIGGVIGAQFGTMIGAKLKAEQLRILLALMVLLVCAKLAMDLIVEPAELFSLGVAGGH